MKQIAILGPTASGKSELALKVAKQHNAYILSIDSLSLYKEVDIISAKPSKEELKEVRHFGINELYVNQYFSVELFIELYNKVADTAKKDGKNLVIVGGTSFYLKMLLDGLSKLPKISQELHAKVENELQELGKCYAVLESVDPEYMGKIAQNDRYRIEKAMLIYRGSKLPPSEYFAKNQPEPVIKNLPIYEIAVQRDLLRERIELRTKKMIAAGAIDEVCFLEQKYTREPNPMHSIGIVEILEYLDGYTTKEQMADAITTHTAQLAKRQQTFNKNQFEGKISNTLEYFQQHLNSFFV